MAPSANENLQVLQALERDNNTWHSVAELAQQTGMSEDVVLQICIQDPEIVKAPSKEALGSPLFTTRKQFSKSASAMTKIIGGIKNRLY